MRKDRYFSLSIDESHAWFLSIAKENSNESANDTWAFSRCKPITDHSTVKIDVTNLGNVVDYNQTTFLATIVSERLAAIYTELARNDVQMIKANIRGRNDKWYVTNILNSYPCVDRANTIGTVYPPNHRSKPGQLSGVIRLAVKPLLIPDNANIFRATEWSVMEIVTERLMENMVRSGITGVKYNELIHIDD